MRKSFGVKSSGLLTSRCKYKISLDLVVFLTANGALLCAMIRPSAMRPQKQLCRPGYWNVKNVKEDIHALPIHGLRLWRGPVSIRAEHTPCVALRVHSSSILGWRFRYGRVVLLCALGFLWAMWRADNILQALLDSTAQGQVLSVAGLINELLLRFAMGSGFVVKVHHAADARGRASILKNLKLNWYDQDKELSVWAYCRLKVRLKVPHGQRNPGTFDRGKMVIY